MPDVTLTTPEIDDLAEDSSDSGFKRRIAMLVMGITLFGSVIAYAETRAGNGEARAAREGQRLAIVALGAQIAADGTLASDNEIYARTKLLDRQRVDAHRQQRDDDARRLSEVRAGVGSLTPLVADPAYANDLRREFFLLKAADDGVAADAQQLRREARATTQGGFARKAGAYVAILTVLAIALSVLGVSLIVPTDIRRLLVFPGVGIAAACLVWSLMVARQSVDQFSESAIGHVAEGNRLLYRAAGEIDEGTARADVDRAIAAFTRAIEDEPRYGTAYRRRAIARFQAASSQSLLQTTYLSVIDAKALTDIVRDEEKAVSLGQEEDAGLLVDLGFQYFLAGRYGDSARITNRSLDLNDEQPVAWFNLAVAEVARGDRHAAERAYRSGIAAARIEADPAGLFAGARTDLEIVAAAKPERTELVERFKAILADAEFGNDDKEVPEGAAIRDLEMEQKGPDLRVTFRYEGIPSESEALLLVSHRADGDKPWSHRPSMTSYLRFWQDGKGTASLFVATGDCPVPGSYRMELYAGTRRLVTHEMHVDLGELGPMVAEADPLFGATFCRPRDWTTERSGDGRLVLQSPDRRFTLSASSFRIPADQVPEERDPYEDGRVANAFGEDAEPSAMLGDFSLGGVARGRAARYDDLPGGGRAGVAAFLGTDDVLRMVIATVPGDARFGVLEDLLRTVRFNDLPAPVKDDQVAWRGFQTYPPTTKD